MKTAAFKMEHHDYEAQTESLNNSTVDKKKFKLIQICNFARRLVDQMTVEGVLIIIISRMRVGMNNNNNQCLNLKPTNALILFTYCQGDNFASASSMAMLYPFTRKQKFNPSSALWKY